MRTLTALILMAALISSTAHSFGLNDLKDNLDRSHKCKSGDDSCKAREKLKAAARVAAIGIAAKLITDMVIDYRSSTIKPEDVIASEYKTEHANLPDEPTATQYTTDTLPGKIVAPGKQVTVRSDITVVPGTRQPQALIEERIAIYDNEDHTKELNTLTKAVNAETKRGGQYQNEFSFTLPEGLPQGVYPIKTELFINGQVAKKADNDIQLVLHVDQHGAFQLLAAAY